MAFKLPSIDKDDLQSIFDWNTSMQDLWNILDDEVSEILDQTSTLNELKDQLEQYFKDFNDSVGPQGDQLLFKVVDDVLDVFEAQLMRRVSGLLFISDIDSGNCKKRAIQKLQNN